MRPFFTIIFSFIFTAYFSQSPNSSEYILKGIEAHNKIKGAELIRMYSYTSIPAFIKFRSSSNIAEENIEKWLIEIQKNNFAGVQFVRKETDELGITHYRFLQTYKGYEVFGTGYIVHCKNGYVQSANGQMYDNITINSINIDEKQGLKLAMNKMGAASYKWQILEEEEHAQHDFEDKIRKTPSYFPKGELKIIPANGNFYSENHSFRLAYVYDLYAHEPMDRKEFFVDAENGKIVFENPLIMHGNTNGTANTAYSGTRTIITDSVTIDSFRLRETGRGNGIQTFNLKKGTNYALAVDFRDSNNIWNNVNANLDQYATDAHWGSEMTYDYFWIKHGRNSIDDAGFMLQSYIHYSSNYTNAFWDGIRMTYGDGASPYTPLVAMDIAGHEIAHGLTSNTSNLVYSYESGALNESFSDIFGVAIDFYARPTLANYLMGDGIGGTPFRSMSNPNLYSDPDTYLGTNWYAGTADNGGVHTNSGVQNYWFYLMINGGIGKNDKNDSFWVSRLGIDTAAKIAFRNNTYYLTSTSQYADARFYAIQSAIDLYGACSKAVKSTTNAWHAVGVGAKYDSTVKANFIALNPMVCSAPQTVKFINLSTNSSIYSWKFGTGDTSSTMNPNYKYTANGTYTVKLIADGGACGIDSITKINYISVDVHNDCVALIGDTINTNCFGTVYDDGGFTLDYSINDSLVFTVSPTGATSILFTKNDFDLEAGTAAGICDYDHLDFYNGASIASPLLGKYCNTNIPPATTSTGSSGTLKMISDPAATGRGFEYKWKCTIPNAKPAVRFSASTFLSCDGIIKFKDESYNTPTSWFWNFGDGGTSTLQNPTYTYNASGVYNVRLIATNAFGSDTFTKLSYITVSRLTAPTATTGKRCGSGTVNLMASSPNTIQWFDSLTSMTILGTGPNFTTPSISATRNYYVQAISLATNKNYGPIDTNIGAGGIHTAIPPAYMIFDAAKPCKLVSIKVRANSTKSRRFQLSDRLGNIIKDTIIPLIIGTQTVTLNFDIPMGTNLRLGIHKDSSAALYRNSAGANYPYTDASGLISIKGHNLSAIAPAAYYYFYNWVVKESDCSSPRVAVNAQIQNSIILKSLDTSICNGATVILTPTGNDIDSIYWTTGSIAANSRTVSPTITTDYIYTAFNKCGSFKDTATITVTKTPTLITSNDTTICNGQSVKLRAFSNININWTSIPSTDTMPIVTPTTTTIYPCVATSSCGTARDTSIVTVLNFPTITARTDTSICQGDSVLLTANSNTTITWLPMNIIANSVKVSPSSATSYSAKATNICGNKFDTVNINVLNLPTLTRSNDTTICIGQSANIKAKSNYTHTWTSLGLTDTLVNVSPSTTTKYPIFVTSTCGIQRDTVTVTVINFPTITARTDTSICQGDSILLTATSNSTITWLPMNIVSNSVKVSPSSATSYSAKASNICGNKYDTININVLNLPTLTRSNDTTICIGQTVNIKAKSNYTHTWTSLGLTDTLVNVSPSTTTKYPIFVTSTCGIKRDTVTVTVLNFPTIIARTDTSICQGDSILLTATSNSTITWLPMNIVANSVKVSPSSATSYSAKATNICGNKYDTVNISLLSLPTLTRNNDTTICNGQTTNIKAKSNYSHTWTTFGFTDTMIFVSPSSTTKYPILVSSICGIKRDTVTVTVMNLPTLTARNDTTICQGDSVLLTATSSSAITWFPMNISSNNIKVAPSNSSIYFAQSTNSCGFTKDTVLINVLTKSKILISVDTTICKGNPVKLKANPIGSLTWLINNTTDSFLNVNPLVTTKYFIQSTSACGLIKDSVNVMVLILPSLTASNDTVICKGKSVILNAVTTNSFLWLSPIVSSTKQITVSPIVTTKYIMRASNICGTIYDTINVVVNQLPKASFTKMNTNLTIAFTNTSTNATSYKWHFGDTTISTLTSPTKTYSAPGSYLVMQIATNSCGTDTLKTYLTVTNSSGIQSTNSVPISIYPNPTNDKLYIDLSQFKSNENFKLSLHDVIGKKVMENEVNGNDIYIINLSHLTKGTYLLRISNDTMDRTEKIVVE